jgi:hypothetical protein
MKKLHKILYVTTYPSKLSETFPLVQDLGVIDTPDRLLELLNQMQDLPTPITTEIQNGDVMIALHQDLVKFLKDGFALFEIDVVFVMPSMASIPYNYNLYIPTLRNINETSLLAMLSDRAEHETTLLAEQDIDLQREKILAQTKQSRIAEKENKEGDLLVVAAKPSFKNRRAADTKELDLDAIFPNEDDDLEGV